jgi:hypothetical protein
MARLGDKLYRFLLLLLVVDGHRGQHRDLIRLMLALVFVRSSLVLLLPLQLHTLLPFSLFPT